MDLQEHVYSVHVVSAAEKPTGCNSPYCQAEIVDLQQLFSSQALGISTDKLRLWAFFCIKCSQIALDKFRKHNVILYEVTCAHP